VVVPIWRGGDPKDEILAAASDATGRLRATGLSVKLDDRDTMSPGAKYHEWELAGVPLRIEIGPKDVAKGSVVCVRRTDRGKEFVSMEQLATRVPTLLAEIQRQLFEAAVERRERATYPVDDFDDFKRKVEDPGGFLLAHWCGSAECEQQVKNSTRATLRCVAFDQPDERGRCIVCGRPSARRAHFAKAY
ncbi:MAG TPA: His/Gly/Thr/Pro-type tRNA ligase C-terminal domain-containing protein, partial [Candidatus Polarisedimenticolaceae bacterium]|nr:His/Gly/Thr/Pro-type tRNA ligase C-terminal domain-containing protein [Candidatus Polarisedimenticolaceae bacterium]